MSHGYISLPPEDAQIHDLASTSSDCCASDPALPGNIINERGTCVLNIRLWHSYIGFFSAPSILFFALTGALQLLGLHEQHGDYQPPAIVEKLSRMHKDQTFELERHDTAPSPAPAAIPQAGPAKHAPASTDEDEAVSLSTQALKWFFFLVALNLVVSTVFGIWIGITHVRRKGTAWALLTAGALIPFGLCLV